MGDYSNMIKSRYYNILTCILFVIGLGLLRNREETVDIRYVEKLFDDSKVHEIDIRTTDDTRLELMTCPEKKTYLPCDIMIDGEMFKGVGIRAKGGTSLNQVKLKENSNRYSLKIKFNKYNRNYTYYGLDELVLNNTISDTTYMKEFFSYDMMRKIGVASPYTSFMKISVNGEYYGLFIGIEGVDNSFLERNYGINHGELYKPKDLNKRSKEPNYYKVYGTDLAYTTENFNDYKGIFKFSKTNSDDTDKRRLINSLKKLDELEAEEGVDVESTLRYFVAHNFINNYDGYTSDILNNYQLYEKDGKISMLPWDYNLGFGGFKGIPYKEYPGDTNKSVSHRIINLDIDNPLILLDPIKYEEERNFSKRPMWTNVMEDKNNRDRYHELFKEFIDSYFKSGYFENKLDNTKELLDEYVKNDNTSFYSYEEYQKGVETLKKYCLLRVESIENQLNGTGQDIEVGDINLEDMGVPSILDKEKGLSINE